MSVIFVVLEEGENAMTKPREPTPTVAFIDDYCAHYRAVFPNVRQFEQFTHLELGLVAETKRKSLPRLAQTTKADPQALHHFIANADWSVEALRAVRLELTRQAVRERPFILCIDETGDRKKGKTTDYAASQYIGNVHTLANGVVSVNAYGVLDTVTFPLAFRIYKPQRRLKPGDIYKSKPQLAVELIQELAAQGLHFSVVLADSMYGESWDFTAALERLGLSYVVAIRSNHKEWVVSRRAGAADPVAALRPRFHRWNERAALPLRVRLWQAHPDPLLRDHHRPRPPAPREHLAIMTNLPGNIERTVGNTFGLRTWIEYGFKHAKDELGWADYRVTDAASIERWWELVMCAYLLVSLQAPALALTPPDEPAPAPVAARQHPAWTEDASWKHRLTNLRLLLQPFVCACLLLPWLRLHPLPQLSAGLADLCAL